ncbi:MAG: hypothetical protein NC310_08870 [Roseburia sp.]|nr:hypothetical protein [Anaeroplasma bactoclasticum]MCM1197160.1 hypothetical protein [Roseburia sp.]
MKKSLIEFFSKYEEEINFEKEMVLLYIFPDVYPNRKYSIKTIHIDNQNLTIYFKLQAGDKKDATAPYQRCLMVKMKQMEIEEVHFVEQ